MLNRFYNAVRQNWENPRIRKCTCANDPSTKLIALSGEVWVWHMLKWNLLMTRLSTSTNWNFLDAQTIPRRSHFITQFLFPGIILMDGTFIRLSKVNLLRVLDSITTVPTLGICKNARLSVVSLLKPNMVGNVLTRHMQRWIMPLAMGWSKYINAKQHGIFIFHTILQDILSIA